jgi:DNA repair ATPase RecN
VVREAEIEAAQLTYSRWEGEERELDQRLAQEEQHVHCLTVAMDTVAFSPADCQEAVNDMQALAADVSMYNNRLDSCRQYLADLAPVLDSGALQCMAERLARLSHRVASLHRQADIMAERLKQPRTATVGVQADLLTSLDAPRYLGFDVYNTGLIF